MKKYLKTMIVDDEEVAADLLEIMLNKLGIKNIATASTGRQALDMFDDCLKSGSPYSLVFLDIMMPEMNGQEILKQMRSAEKEAGIASFDRSTIIMTTALTSTDAMVEAIFEGDCSDYLVKPVSSEYLREMLANNGFISVSR